MRLLKHGTSFVACVRWSAKPTLSVLSRCERDESAYLKCAAFDKDRVMMCVVGKEQCAAQGTKQIVSQYQHPPGEDKKEEEGKEDCMSSAESTRS